MKKIFLSFLCLLLVLGQPLKADMTFEEADEHLQSYLAFAWESYQRGEFEEIENPFDYVLGSMIWEVYVDVLLEDYIIETDFWPDGDWDERRVYNDLSWLDFFDFLDSIGYEGSQLTTTYGTQPWAEAKIAQQYFGAPYYIIMGIPDGVGRTWNAARSGDPRGVGYHFTHTVAPPLLLAAPLPFVKVVKAPIPVKPPVIAPPRIGSSGTTVAPRSTGNIANTTGQLLGRSPSSRILGQNLEATGIPRPPNSAAHHIVSGLDGRAAQARAILRRDGVNINEAANGVFLPRISRFARPPSATHSRIHTNRYYTEITRRLQQAQPGTAHIVLRQIADELAAGTFPY